MEFIELIQDFGAKFGIEGIQTDGNESLKLTIDDMTLEIFLAPDRKTVFLCSEFGNPPPDGESQFNQIMLKANFLLQSTQGATLAQNPETNGYVLNKPVPLLGLDLDSFCEIVEAFVNQIEEWSRLLDNFRPVGEAMKASNDEIGSIVHPIADGFIRA